MTETYDNEAIFREMLATLNRHEGEALAEGFTEDGTVIDYTNPSVVHRGRAAIAALAQANFEALPDISFEVVSLVAGGDHLSAELLMRATPAGQSEPAEVNLCGLYVFSDGKVVSEHVYMDSAQLALVGGA